MNAPAIVRVPTWRPMLYSGPMVRAVLEHRKTKTRRVMKPQPPDVGRIFVGRYAPAVADAEGELQPGPEIFGAYDEDGEWGVRCPYGEPGDRLWVRETFAWCNHEGEQPSDEVLTHVLFRADGEARDVDSLRWTPSIYMPRQISRISLAVTSVGVERLHAITEDDARAEGVEPCRSQDFWSCFCANTHDMFDMTIEPDDEHKRARGITSVRHQPGNSYTAREEFQRLWTSINGRRPGCAWADNPWVWVIGFDLLEVRDV